MRIPQMPRALVHYFVNNYTSVANEVNNLFLLFLPLCKSPVVTQVTLSLLLQQPFN
jgi:hypothetical protein